MVLLIVWLLGHLRIVCRAFLIVWLAQIVLLIILKMICISLGLNAFFFNIILMLIKKKKKHGVRFLLIFSIVIVCFVVYFFMCL
jgi:hypothetical protein